MQTLQQYEPVGWAEELLDVAAIAGVRQLPRLYTAASFCSVIGRPEAGLGYAQKAVALEADPGYDGFGPGWSRRMEAVGQVYSGRIDRCLEICADLAADPHPGLGRVVGLSLGLWMMPLAGRADHARVIAEETLATARAFGDPVCVTAALGGYGMAFAPTDPQRALRAFREQIAYCRQHRLLFLEGSGQRDAAWLEALHGDLGDALEMFDSAIDGFHRAGDHPNLANALARLAVSFDHIENVEVAATLSGVNTRYGSMPVPGLSQVVDHARSVLGRAVFDSQVATGAAMELGDAVAYARAQIRFARSQPRQSA